MLAVAFKLRNIDQDRPGVTSDCDVNCYNLYTRMSVWMRYTPEFQLTVVLWGMTSKQTLRTMMSGEKDKAMALQFLLTARSLA
jgi:hypothetical protein